MVTMLASKPHYLELFSWSIFWNLYVSAFIAAFATIPYFSLSPYGATSSGTVPPASAGPPRQATGPSRSGAGVAVGMLLKGYHNVYWRSQIFKDSTEKAMN